MLRLSATLLVLSISFGCSATRYTERPQSPGPLVVYPTQPQQIPDQSVGPYQPETVTTTPNRPNFPWQPDDHSGSNPVVPPQVNVPTPPQTTPNPIDPPQQDEENPTAIDGNQVDVVAFTKAFNDLRARYSKSAMRYDAKLTQGAAQNNRMQMSRGLGHWYMGPGAMGQNSGWNYSTISSVLYGWETSPGHFRNLMLNAPCFGIHWLAPYWTLDLGSCS